MNAIKTHGKGKLGAALLACLMFVFALALTACLGASSAAAALSDAVDSQTAMARVTAVDGNAITVDIMGGGQGGPGGSGGEPPAKPGEDASATTDGAATDNGATANNASVTVEDADAATTDAAADQNTTSTGGDQAAATDSCSSQGGPGGNGGEPPAKPDGDGGQPPAKPGESSDQATDAAAGDAVAQTDNATSAEADDATATDATASTQDNEPPAMPGGDSSQGQGGMPGGTEMTLTVNDESIIVKSGDNGEEQAALSDITEGTMLELTIGDDGTSVTKIAVSEGMGQGGPGSSSGQGAPGSSTGNTGTGATTITSDTTEDGKTYASESTDENALRVEGATATISNATVTKTGDSSSSEDSDFYGLNAGVLALDGANLTIEGASIDTDSKGSNGIFAYGEGTTVNVSNTTINATQGNSGGVEVAGGATLNASNLTVDTQGESSASIRSDRGGGTETVNGGTYTTHGKHSPAVYSTADVTVNDAQLTAENCEGVVIEGLNSVALNNCDMTANVNDVATRTGISNGVMIYQSMSGDAEEGTGSFSMKGGTFTNTSSTLFYVTNTSAEIALENVEIENSGSDVIVIAGNDGEWGNTGSNGGTVVFTAIDQELDGNITVDEISSLTLKLTGDSDLEGAINADGQAGEVNVEMEADSEWTLTADSYVTSLTGDTSGIDLNGHKLYVNGEVWQG
ncbi:MAG: hypothetical protein ACOYIP_02170 [Coriobacteriales bacterium]|jgi:hypothetical protein